MALPNRFLIFPLIGVSTLLSCGDAYLTPEIAAPPPENPYVAIYRAQCCEGDDYYDRTDLLYKVDRQGNIIPLADEPAPGTFIAGPTASPEGHFAAYWEGDRQEPGGTARHSALVIQSLVTADDRQEFLVTTDGPANVQIDWLPDSSGVLLATGELTATIRLMLITNRFSTIWKANEPLRWISKMAVWQEVSSGWNEGGTRSLNSCESQVEKHGGLPT